MEVRLEIPAWIVESADTDQLLYEISRLVKDAIAILNERVRTSEDRVVKRAIARLVIAKAGLEALISIRRAREIIRTGDVEEKLSELIRELEARIGRLR